MTLEQWLQGTVHADKVHDAARKAFISDMTATSFDEHLHRATLDAAATAVRAFLGSEEVRHRVARALHGLDNNDDLWLPGWFDVEARAALSSIMEVQNGR